MSTIVYLVRHGESEHNRDSVISGHVNPSLTAAGIKQAKIVNSKLKNVHFDEVYSSDLKRAVHTAELITGLKVPKKNQYKDLRERSFGTLEGKAGQILINYRNEENYLKLSNQNKWKHKFVHNMESNSELADRAIKVIKRIADLNDEKTILIATHGGVIRSFLVGIQYKSLDKLPPGSVLNTAYVKLIFNNNKFKVEKTFGITSKSSY